MSEMHRGTEPLFTREMCRNLCQFMVQVRMLRPEELQRAAEIYNQSLGMSTRRLEEGAMLYVSSLLSAFPEMRLGGLPGDFVRRWMWECLRIMRPNPSGRMSVFSPVSDDAPTIAKPALAPVERPEARQPVAPRQQMIGRYPVEKPLAKGGMGEVYVGRHPDIDVRVAIKTIRPEVADDEGLARFRLEAKTLWALDHPNLLRCYEVNFEQQPHFIVMPFIDGATLDDVYVKRKPRGEDDLLWRLRLMRDICRGVGHMHSQGLVHRDLKPKNIFIDKTGRPIVGDPGLVKKMGVQEQARQFTGSAPESGDDAGLTQFGAVMGTIPFMAPEQGEGDPNRISPAADVYSLGKILFWLLTRGVHVHAGTQPMAILAKVFEPQIPDVVYDELRKKIYKRHEPQRAIDIVVRCLQHKPQDRYRDAGELADALDAYASWLETHEAAEYEALRRRYRNAGMALAVLSCTALLTAAAAWSYRQSRIEAEGRALAQADARSKAEALAAAEAGASSAARLRVELANGLGRAQTLVKNAKWDEAERLLLGIVNRDDRYAPARMLLADVQFNLLKASCVDHWLWLASNGPEPDRSRNAFLAAFGQQQLATPTPERNTASIAAAITEQPYATLGQVLVRLDEADACRMQGRAEQSVTKLDEARRLAESADVSPESEWIISFVRGRVLYQGVAAANLGPQRPANLVEACRLFERSALLNPDFGLAWFFFGDSAKLLGQYRTAQTAFLRGQMMVPYHAAMRYMYADTLIQWAGEQIRTRQAATQQNKPVPDSLPPMEESLRMLMQAINLCRDVKEADRFQNPEQVITCSLVQVNGYVFRIVGLQLAGKRPEAESARLEAAKVVREIEAMPGLRPGSRETLAQLRQRLGL